MLWLPLFNRSCTTPHNPHIKCEARANLQHKEEKVRVKIYMYVLWLVLTCDRMEDRHWDGVINIFLFCYEIKQIDSMLTCNWVSDYRRHKDKVRSSATHPAIPLYSPCVLITFLCHLWSVTVETHSNMDSIYFVRCRCMPTKYRVCMYVPGVVLPIQLLPFFHIIFCFCFFLLYSSKQNIGCPVFSKKIMFFYSLTHIYSCCCVNSSI